jgi:hypothetical protein
MGSTVKNQKIIKSILIGTHLHIPNIYTSRGKILKFEKKTTMLGTYENVVQF